MDYICPRCNANLSNGKDPRTGNRVLICLTYGCTYSATIAEWQARDTIEPLKRELAEARAERDALREKIEDARAVLDDWCNVRINDGQMNRRLRAALA